MRTLSYCALVFCGALSGQLALGCDLSGDAIDFEWSIFADGAQFLKGLEQDVSGTECFQFEEPKSLVAPALKSLAYDQSLETLKTFEDEGLEVEIDADSVAQQIEGLVLKGDEAIILSVFTSMTVKSIHTDDVWEDVNCYTSLVKVFGTDGDYKWQAVPYGTECENFL